MSSRPACGNRAFILANTRAGGHDLAAIEAALERHLTPAGVQWELYARKKGESRRAICRDALERGFTALVAAGGDGTISKVADVLSHTDIPLGVLPTGTGNLFARELGLPLDIDAAARLLVEGGEARRVDVMDLGKRRCISHVSMGVYSKIAEADTPEAKRALGRLAYIGYLSREIAENQRWRFALDIDGQHHEVEASMVLAANVGAVGLGRLRWGSSIRPDDGVIDVCVVRATSAGEFLSLAGAALLGDTEDSPHIQHFPAREHLRVSAADLPVRGDGKKIGEDRFEIRVRPAALSVIVPASSD